MHRVFYISIIGFILWLLPKDSSCQITFSTYRIIAIGAPNVVSIKDINNDGLNDVVIATGGGYNDTVHDYELLVFLQDALGNLKNPVQYSWLSEFDPTSIAVADVNNDLLNDVIIGLGYTDSIVIFSQNTSGKLSLTDKFYSGDYVDALNAGDLNNDGLIDIAVSHRYESFIKIFYQGITGFTIDTFPAPVSGYTEIEIADMNNDKLNDLVLMKGEWSLGGYVYKQNNFGSLDNYIKLSSLTYNLAGIGLGDLNNDGKNDIAASVYANTPFAKVRLWFQDTTANLFGMPYEIPAHDCPAPVEIADLNCDGKNEIIVLHGGSFARVAIFEQNSSGQYVNYTAYPSLTGNYFFSRQGLAVGDINNDGKKDIVISANDTDEGLTILLNTSSASVTITTSGNTSICTGSSITLSASGASNYTWSPPSGLNTTTGSTVIATPTATTTYTVNAANSCGVTASSITVSVHPVPLASVSPNTTICSGSTITLNANGGTNYLWSTGAAGSSISVNPMVSTTYSVSVSNGMCADDTSVTVTVNPSPVSHITGNMDLCRGQTTSLSASGGGSYLWSTGETNSFISVTPTATTSYSVVVTAANSCTGTAVATVNVTQYPVASITPGTTICSGGIVSLTASGGTNYIWSTGATTSSIQANPYISANYSVVVANGNCRDTASTYETVNASPIAATSGNVTIYQGESATLSASGGVNYVWSKGEITSTIMVQPTVSTIYCVEVSNTNNCKDTACATVTVESPCDKAGALFLPNVFSPNGDGENDVLKIYYDEMSCIENLHLMIYDRWGQRVYETADPDFSWDGKYHGRIMDTKVFVCYLSVRFTDGTEINKKTNVSLMR